MIEVKDVYKHFDVRDKRTRTKKRIDAVRGISLQVKPGESLELLYTVDGEPAAPKA